MISFIRVSIYIFLTLSFLSCTNNDDLSDNPSPTELTQTLTSNRWKISYYQDRDKEKTASFSGYIFEFRQNNMLIATKAGASINGSWSTIKDSGKTKMNLSFQGPGTFEEITEDWEFKSQSAARIELIHISGGDGHQDFLTFERI